MLEWWKRNILVIGYIKKYTKKYISNDVIFTINKFYGYKIIKYENGEVGFIDDSHYNDWEIIPFFRQKKIKLISQLYQIWE